MSNTIRSPTISADGYSFRTSLRDLQFACLAEFYQSCSSPSSPIFAAAFLTSRLAVTLISHVRILATSCQRNSFLTGYFAQLVSGGLASCEGKLKHPGVDKASKRTTLSYANLLPASQRVVTWRQVCTNSDSTLADSSSSFGLLIGEQSRNGRRVSGSAKGWIPGFSAAVDTIKA